MLVSTLISMVSNLQRFLVGDEPNILLGTMGAILLILGVAHCGVNPDPVNEAS